MIAYSLPSFNVRATVTSVEIQDVNIVVWMRGEGDGDAEPIPVAFQRFGDHVDPVMIETAAELQAGDVVHVQYTQIAEGQRTINLGRSITKPGDDNGDEVL